MLFEAKIDLESINLDDHLEGILKPSLKREAIARIAVNRSAVPQIGKAFGEAAIDAEKRAELVSDPAAYLRKAGVAEEDLAGLNLVVHQDTPETIHLVLPEAVDGARLKANDHEYLKLLGTMAVLGCIAPLR